MKKKKISKLVQSVAQIQEIKINFQNKNEKTKKYIQPSIEGGKDSEFQKIKIFFQKNGKKKIFNLVQSVAKIQKIKINFQKKRKKVYPIQQRVAKIQKLK